MRAHHFSHCDNRRCRRTMSELAGVMSPSCSDHSQIFVHFQTWNCWGLCLGIDVGPPLLTLLRPEMPTDGARSGRCDQPLMPLSHPYVRPAPTVKLLGTMLRNRSWPTTFHTITTGDANGWNQKLPVWSTHHAPIHQTFRPVPTLKLLGTMLKSRCWPTHLHTITSGDVNGWCQKWPVWSTPQAMSIQRDCWA